MSLEHWDHWDYWMLFANPAGSPEFCVAFMFHRRAQAALNRDCGIQVANQRMFSKVTGEYGNFRHVVCLAARSTCSNTLYTSSSWQLVTSLEPLACAIRRVPTITIRAVHATVRTVRTVSNYMVHDPPTAVAQTAFCLENVRGAVEPYRF